jgi:uncharacterized membrane protein
MSRKSLGIASIILLLALLIVALAVGNRLPPNSRLPTHWGLDGRPDGFSGKWPALLLPPAMMALISLLLWFLPVLEPRGRNFSRSIGLYLWTWTGLLLVIGSLELVIVAGPLHWQLRVDDILIGAIGMMFVLMGNQLGKSRSMYMFGIRTPWTLASEEVWIKTHRLGGKLMVTGGLAMVTSAFLPLPSVLAAALFGVVVAVVAGVPIVYSYIMWRRERAQPSE